jgi:hypothetical protein
MRSFLIRSARSLNLPMLRLAAVTPDGSLIDVSAKIFHFPKSARENI